MTYEFGDIILVPFPFTDQTSLKKRPSVVISSIAYNTARLDVILMGVSSQVSPSLLFGELRIQDWQTAGLLKPSVVKPVVTTLENRLVIRQLGKLQASDCEALEQLLRLLLQR
jgi:mRNA interferase MazF